MAKELVTYKIKESLINGEPTVAFTIGVQTFTLQEMESKESAEWYIKQLKTAFANLIREVVECRPDIPISGLSVHNKECNGCIRHERDVLVTFTTESPEFIGRKVDFHDFFLTTAQAIHLRDEIDKILKQNKENL